ncbi:hypothetical protein PRUB_a3582 [Pseudoalteromonas rubra]|uniref:Uncharacterized protein n=1 Tax=Pseudoalteromonas rubra TaxID=43658 RepID=A0A8T0C563_9GAMM|nr:hypothetical protein PRUB_a3582 [Pseudoalteromonas rubra]
MSPSFAHISMMWAHSLRDWILSVSLDGLFSHFAILLSQMSKMGMQNAKMCKMRNDSRSDDM